MVKETVARIEEMAKAHGIDDFRWIHPKSVIIQIQQWVRTRCFYGIDAGSILPFQVLKGYEDETNRFGLLLIE